MLNGGQRQKLANYYKKILAADVGAADPIGFVGSGSGIFLPDPLNVECLMYFNFFYVSFFKNCLQKLTIIQYTCLCLHGYESLCHTVITPLSRAGA